MLPSFALVLRQPGRNFLRLKAKIWSWWFWRLTLASRKDRVTPRWWEFFHKRGHDIRATKGIGLDEVFNAVMIHLKVPEAKAGVV